MNNRLNAVPINSETCTHWLPVVHVHLWSTWLRNLLSKPTYEDLDKTYISIYASTVYVWKATTLRAEIHNRTKVALKNLVKYAYAVLYNINSIFYWNQLNMWKCILTVYTKRSFCCDITKSWEINLYFKFVYTWYIWSFTFHGISCRSLLDVASTVSSCTVSLHLNPNLNEHIMIRRRDLIWPFRTYRAKFILISRLTDALYLFAIKLYKTYNPLNAFRIGLNFGIILSMNCFYVSVSWQNCILIKLIFILYFSWPLLCDKTHFVRHG